ncbi:hypothetical protein [Nonomuraea sp. NPDC003214]
MSDPLNLVDALTDRLGADQARAAVETIAEWAWAQVAIAEHASSPAPFAEKPNARAYRQLARAMGHFGAAPANPHETLSELAAAVWCTLADAGHTAALDSPTGDGYQISYMPGAVLVTLVRGTGLAGLPWAAIQRQILHGWANALTAAGYTPRFIGDVDAPRALRVPTPAGGIPELPADAKPTPQLV